MFQTRSSNSTSNSTCAARARMECRNCPATRVRSARRRTRELPSARTARRSPPPYLWYPPRRRGDELNLKGWRVYLKPFLIQHFNMKLKPHALSIMNGSNEFQLAPKPRHADLRPGPWPIYYAHTPPPTFTRLKPFLTRMLYRSTRPAVMMKKKQKKTRIRLHRLS